MTWPRVPWLGDLAGLCKRWYRARTIPSESGDTLIEILIAIVVIALTVTALLGALMTSITSSSTQRSLSSIDTILNSFAQSAQSEIDQPSTFVNCPKQGYELVSPPFPSSGPSGTPVTMFATGFAAGIQSVTIGSSPPIAATNLQTHQTSTGDWTITFDVPSGAPSGPQPVAVTGGGITPSPSPTFNVAGAAQVATSLSGYSASVSSVEQWDSQGSVWVLPTSGTCPQSGSELVTLSAAASDGTSGSVSFVATGAAGTTVDVTAQCTTLCSSGGIPTLGGGAKFTATVIPPNSTTPVPQGSVTWSISGPGNLSCTSTTPLGPSGTGNQAAATCSISSGLEVGTYIGQASYTGTNYSNGVCSPPQGSSPGSCGSINVQPAPTSVTLSDSWSNTGPSPLPGAQISFQASVEATSPVSTDPTPQGQIQWTFSNSPGRASCTNTSLSGTGDVSSATCKVTAVPGTYNLMATYVNAGDGNYVGGSQATLQPALTVSQATPVITVKASPSNPQTGSTFTIAVSVTGPTGATPPTGTATWSVTAPSPGPNPPGCGGNFSVATGATCTVTGALTGSYGVSVNYQGDVNYTSQSYSGSISVLPAPAGLNIQGFPVGQPPSGKPTTGDQIVYTYNQAMSVASIQRGWSGSQEGVTVTFSRLGTGETQMTVNCTGGGFGGCNTINLGTVDLGDTGTTHYLNGGFGGGSVTLNANMTASTNSSGQTVITITLTSSNNGSFNAITTATTLTWSPSAAVTSSTSGLPCSTATVTENNPASQRNF